MVLLSHFRFSDNVLGNVFNVSTFTLSHLGGTITDDQWNIQKYSN